MINGTWDTLNWVGTGLFFVLMMYAIMVTLELSNVKNKNYVWVVPLIMFGSMTAFFFVSAAPTYSYMERDFWQDQLTYEASMELVEERVAERMDQLTVDFGADIPAYCARQYPYTRTEEQKRHCYMLEIHRMMERYAVQTGANNE